MQDIKSQLREELESQFESWGQPPYRVAQLLEWLYVQHVIDWNAMKNLPGGLRAKLREHFSLQALQLVCKQGSPDTTEKFLWRLADQSLIESVLIPANPALYGEASDRHTLCISTQVGCAYGCKFCASGLEGWKRNLQPHEIVEQVLSIERLEKRDSPDSGCLFPHAAPRAGEPPPAAPQTSGENSPRVPGRVVGRNRLRRAVDNIVVMGMGEPLANYDNLMKALRVLNAPWGGAIGARKITISTSGLAPQIRKLAAEPLQFRLAVSLHGATDEVRGKIMPVNKKYPLSELVSACSEYQAKKGRMITLEYILIAGVNDSVEQTRPLAALAKTIFAKVNLIPYNTVEGLPWNRPSDDRCEQFLKALQRQKVTATLRREKGHDIDAACGQLRLKTQRELAK